MQLEPGMSATTDAGPAIVMFVAFDDAGDMSEIVMKLDQPKFGYSFVLFSHDSRPTLHMVQ